MPLDDLNKPNNGIGLNRYWKDLFPDRLTKLYVYKGVNQTLRGASVFSREDDVSIISLKLIDTIEGIFGGESYQVAPLSLEEDKAIKELTLSNIPQKGFSAFLRELKHDYAEDDLYFTLGGPFQSSDINKETKKVYVSIPTSPGSFSDHIRSFESLSDDMRAAAAESIVSWNLTPAVLQNNLPSSRIAFVSSDIFHPLPNDKNGFEITSLEIEADQTFMPEFKNWISATGKLLYVNGKEEESPILFKADKPLLPIQIAPYAKTNKLEFAIKNFNNKINMPWLYAKKFLGNNTSIKEYIAQGNTATWVTDLSKAIVNMFVMSWAFSTNFKAYRNSSGEITDGTIGGISVKSLENKDPTAIISQILKNWQYSGNTINIHSPEYNRAIQILVASSQWVPSNWSIGGVESEAHKSLLDWYLDLETVINSGTTDINMKLNSLRYEFDITDLSNPKIKNIKDYGDESSVLVDKTDRLVSIPELDDPIDLETFVNFPKDINLSKSDSFKYFVGVDITNPNKIEEFFINQETASEKIETITVYVDTIWDIKTKPPTGDDRFRDIRFHEGQTVDGLQISSIFSQSPSDLIKNALQIPPGAFDLAIITDGTKTEKVASLRWDGREMYGSDRWRPEHRNLDTTIVRYTGAEIQYKIKTKARSVDNKKITFNKATYYNEIINYTDSSTFKRVLSISDDFKDENGNQTVKIKSIDRIWLSFILGNHVDIKINYQYDNPDKPGSKIVGFSTIPRLELPSKHEERRTKFGIRL